MRIESIFHKISLIIVCCILSTITISGLFVQSTYNYYDYPFFEIISARKWIAITGVALLTSLYLYIGYKLKWNLITAALIHLTISIVYILTVQLEPFSDMSNVYNIAANGLTDDTGYLSTYNNQIPLTVYLWIIVSIFGKSIMVPKVCNIILNFIILLLIYKIVIELTNSSDTAKISVWLSAIWLSCILYINHIYNDILFTALTLAMVYIVVKGSYTKPEMIVLCALSVIQYLIRPCGILYIIAIAMYMIMKQKVWRRCLTLLAIAVSMIILTVNINNRLFNVDKTKSFPVWSFIQMGINEEEFGFQDGTHSTEWTFGDCIDKYKNMGFMKVTKTLTKKELWMWTEGTYQAERYGFGGYESTFAHENRITDSIKDVDNSRLRMIIDFIMKAQYYIYMTLALAGVIITRSNRNYSLFNYCICGFACFYLIWEMKSRYIYSLYPLFIIYAVIGIEYIFNKILEKSK